MWGGVRAGLVTLTDSNRPVGLKCAASSTKGLRMRAKNRSGRTALAAAALATMLTAAACSSDGSDEPRSRTPAEAPSQTSSPSPSSTPPLAPPTVVPLKFDVANQTTFPEVDVRDIAITDATAWTLTPERITARSLPALRKSYELTAGDGAFVDLWVEGGGDTAVAVEISHAPGRGTSVGSDTYTVRRFHRGSGAVTNEVSVEVAQNAASGPAPASARVAGISGEVVVLDVWATNGLAGDAFAEAVARHGTVAVDLAAGKLAWLARPARPLDVLDQQVIVNTGRVEKSGRIESLAPDTGLVRWTALPGTTSAALVGTSGDRLTVTRSQPNNRTAVASLSLNDGATTSIRPTKSWNWSCFDTGTSTSLCTVVGKTRVFGWNLDRGVREWRLPTQTRFAPAVSTVHRDAVYGLLGGVRGVVLDALTGVDLAEDSGAAPSRVSNRGGLSIVEGQAVYQPATAEN